MYIIILQNKTLTTLSLNGVELLRQRWQQFPHFKMTLDIPHSNISTGRAIRLTLLNNNQVDNNGNRQYVTKYSIVKGFSQFSVSIKRTFDAWRKMGNVWGKLLLSISNYVSVCFSKINCYVKKGIGDCTIFDTDQ